MNEWMNQDVFKTWTDAQKRLWESLSTTLPAFKPPEGFELWHETYRTNISAWETAVKQSLTMQASWLEQWAQRVADEKGTPESMAAWSRQVEEVTQHWITTQNALWDRWFEMLRASRDTRAASAPKPAASQSTPPPRTTAADPAAPVSRKPDTPPTIKTPTPKVAPASQTAARSQASTPATPATPATPKATKSTESSVAGTATGGVTQAKKPASASKSAKPAPARKRTTKKAD